MNKKKILEMLLERLNMRIASSSKALRTVHDDIEDSPSPSQSHSDTTRSQLSEVANEITKVIETTRGDAEILSKAISLDQIPTCDNVGIWAVMEVEGESESNWYMILPVRGGEEIEFDGTQITIIGIDSPIALNSMGKAIGEEFSVGEQSFWISDLF